MKIKFNFNYKEIIKGLIISLLILILIVSIGYSTNSSSNNVWAATIVAQIGVSLIWLSIRLGLFSVSSRGSRRLGNAFRDRSKAKLGVYRDINNKKSTPKQSWELQKDNGKKSKQGIYIMLIFGIIEALSTLWLFI